MELKEILQKNGFRFNKALGQNFLQDKNLLDAIVHDAGITAEDTVVEIGTGAGTLTRAISAVAKKVYTFEVDRRLAPILDEVLQDCTNVTVLMKDIMRMKDSEFSELIAPPFKVVANLPYYITTPLLMRFVESELGATSVTVTVQKEVAERIAGRAGTEDFGAITLQVDLRGTAQLMRQISRQLFFPVPNVDSAVLRVDLDPGKHGNIDMKAVSKLIKAAFMMRRKTLVNNLSAAYSLTKEELKALLVNLGYLENVRGETMTTEQYIELEKELKKLLQEKI